MRNAKLLVFHPALAPYRVDFFNAINEVYNASFYFNLQNVPDQKFDQQALQKKCTFKSNYILSGFELFGRSFRSGIIPIIKKEKPDIIICSEYGQVTLMVFLYKLLKGKKFKLYTISDDSLNNSKLRKGFRALIRKIVLKNITGVIFPSEEVCVWHQQNISKSLKTLQLPIIHDEEVFRTELFHSIGTANENISKYNLIGKKVILFVGRLVEVKNLFFLIRVISELKSTDWQLIIVGDGILKEELKIVAENLNISDKINFIGRKEGNELLAWYTFAHVLILPSSNEQFGAVVNEGLLGGCKVLCSTHAGASCLINDTNGKIFNPNDEQDLLNCLNESLNQIETSTEHIISLRNSIMPFRFNTMISTLFENL
jgi:glycosyltransferase involved in cell wall biosynthesis